MTMTEERQERACGNVVEGGLYSGLPGGPGGIPLHEFLIDPPIVFPQLDLAPIGVQVVAMSNILDTQPEGRIYSGTNGRLYVTASSNREDKVVRAIHDTLKCYGLETSAMKLERTAPPLFSVPSSVADALTTHPTFHNYEGSKTYHILDIVGRTHYPTVAHFIEEARYMLRHKGMGFHRRLPANADILNKLSVYSKHILLHDRARVENWHDFLDGSPAEWICPTRRANHDPDRAASAEFEAPCLGLAWRSLEGGEPVYTDTEGWRTRVVSIDIPVDGGKYTIYGRRPPSGAEPDFRLAAFAQYPVRIYAYTGGNFEDSYEKAQGAARRDVPLEVRHA